MNRQAKLKRRAKTNADKPRRVAKHLELIALKQIRDLDKEAYWKTVREAIAKVRETINKPIEDTVNETEEVVPE